MWDFKKVLLSMGDITVYLYGDGHITQGGHEETDDIGDRVENWRPLSKREVVNDIIQEVCILSCVCGGGGSGQ